METYYAPEDLDRFSEMGRGSVPMAVEKGRGASSDAIALEIECVGCRYSHDLEVA